MAESHPSRGFAAVAIMLTGVSLLMLLSTYQASQWVPEFYAAELAADASNSIEKAHQLEQQILEVYNAVQNEGDWRVTISDDQINGWLASQLQKQFPYLLPHHASDPRVKIQDDEAHLACQYSNGRMSAVLSMAVEAFATDKPNMVGVRIVNARVGAVPGLMGTAVDQISWGARRSRIRLRWQQKDGQPVALIEIPECLLNEQLTVCIEQIELGDGQLVLAGNTRAEIAEPQLPPTPRPTPILTTANRDHVVNTAQVNDAAETTTTSHLRHPR